MVTDEDGRYVFDGLPAFGGNITVRGPCYPPDEYSRACFGATVWDVIKLGEWLRVDIELELFQG